jgi:hypothetical protein
MIATKIKAKIEKNRKVTISVPDIPPGDVEIIILREEKIIHGTNRLVSCQANKVG